MAADAGNEQDGQTEARWKAFGAWLAGLREAAGLSKREAARRTQISDSTWRALENGGRTLYGTWVTPNPERYILHQIAFTLGVNAAEVFARCGRDLEPSEADPADYDPFAEMEAIRVRIARLEAYLRAHHPAQEAAQRAPQHGRRGGSAAAATP